jgi:hypothetical protein
MSTPVVVQGTAVRPAFGLNPSPLETGHHGDVEHQPAKGGCKDPIFVVLFYLNVIAIAAVALTSGLDAFSDTAEFTYEGYIYAALVSAFLSLFLSALGLSVLMCIPATMIKVSLIFTVIAAGVWAAIAFMSGNLLAALLGLIFFALGVCYARAVWGRYVETVFV